ncbi:hypothetical protein DUNSADRAFT_8751 [Dunaliella salina]|uniref:Encoded protein n=1 Tax=Dunaliella salina TaxID=3046 RepID=A0ABQ7GIV5_DUNSA|nr:hypothetical protein DUNSADRAFT_8751 [Dunaliella salina]|eukprot:KAF5834544.1 hypothetical protein DUNSADRAFT_8751 [Dunaliella salina]
MAQELPNPRCEAICFVCLDGQRLRVGLSTFLVYLDETCWPCFLAQQQLPPMVFGIRACESYVPALEVRVGCVPRTCKMVRQHLSAYWFFIMRKGILRGITVRAKQRVYLQATILSACMHQSA